MEEESVQCVLEHVKLVDTQITTHKLHTFSLKLLRRYLNIGQLYISLKLLRRSLNMDQLQILRHTLHAFLLHAGILVT